MTKNNTISSIELDTFRLHFQSFNNQYILIGGTATKILLDEAGLPNTRTTKDLDIVLCIEALTHNFVVYFWQFIKDGGYECYVKSGDKRCLYRFLKPSNPNYPYMLELLSDKSIQMEGIDQVTHPIVVEDDLVSLSAIMLNEEYYQFITRNKREINGLMVVNEIAIIPLKVCAFLDLSEKKANDPNLNSFDISKHKNDIFRLVQLLRNSPLDNIPDLIKQDIKKFCETINDHPSILKQLNVAFESLEEIRDVLIKVYCSV